MKKTAPPQKRTFKAGCQRTWEIVTLEPDLAYLELAFPECPTCMHLVEPEGAKPFCTLRPQDAPHPFASLGKLKL